uniref:Uncharacterized protein n=1 Tax=Craspedostauros australis TaxID=1486917 RepID=A0A7R9ZPQ8_9STRA
MDTGGAMVPSGGAPLSMGWKPKRRWAVSVDCVEHQRHNIVMHMASFSESASLSSSDSSTVSSSSSAESTPTRTSLLSPSSSPTRFSPSSVIPETLTSPMSPYVKRPQYLPLSPAERWQILQRIGSPPNQIKKAITRSKLLQERRLETNLLHDIEVAQHQARQKMWTQPRHAMYSSHELREVMGIDHAYAAASSPIQLPRHRSSVLLHQMSPNYASPNQSPSYTNVMKRRLDSDIARHIQSVPF